MKSLGLCLGILTFAAGTAAAQPVVYAGGVVNVASYGVVGMPNASVAQGSIVAIFGTGLGPTTAVQVSAFPLATTFQGVSIAVSQGATTVAAIPLYVSAAQINAVMPSNAPLGADTITVTFNGQTSAVVPVSVIPANFGIFAVNQMGSGQGMFSNGQGRAVLYTSPTTPGEVLNIWGTGLGAIPASDTGPPAAGNVAASSPMVYVGGVMVTPTYHGRSPCCSGVDQIQFQVPPDIVGCNVPVAVQIGNIVSNFTSIAIASPVSGTTNGGACSDPSGISAADFTSFAAQGTVSTGYVTLSRITSSGPYSGGTSDYGYANFEKYPYASFSLTQRPLQIVNFGACSVWAPFSKGGFGASLQGATPAVNLVQGVGLDAGSVISIAGPNGGQQITPRAPEFPTDVGSYYGLLAGPQSYPLPILPPFLDPGSYTITGPGGKDVAPFAVSLTMPTPLTWTNESSISNITRADGVTVSWSGADPSSYVIISGDSGVLLGAGAGFNCTAKASDGQFTVPAVVLLALPASFIIHEDGQSQPAGSLRVGSIALPVRFSAAGLGTALANSSVSFAKILAYQ